MTQTITIIIMILFALSIFAQASRNHAIILAKTILCATQSILCIPFFFITLYLWTQLTLNFNTSVNLLGNIERMDCLFFESVIVLCLSIAGASICWTKEEKDLSR